jgi:hypothetical protein
VEEGFAADEMLDETTLDGLVPDGVSDEVLGPAALALLYPDEAVALEVLDPKESAVKLLYPDEPAVLEVFDLKGTAALEVVVPDETASPELLDPKEDEMVTVELLLSNEGAILELLALEVSEEEGMEPTSLVDICELSSEVIVVDEGMTPVWLLEISAVEIDSDTLGEVSKPEGTGIELGIEDFLLSSSKLLDKCEVITEVSTVNESMAPV